MSEAFAQICSAASSFSALIENLDRSLPGMSFLKRLKSFEMREGALTIGW